MLSQEQWPCNAVSNLFDHMDFPTKLGPRWPTLRGSAIVTPPFLVAVALLVAAAGLAGPVANWLQIKQGKRPLPLKTPLNALDEKSMTPYRVLRRNELEPPVVEALGTEMYISWMLEDTSVSGNDPLRYAHLLISYDTGGHNLVPHTPDVCWLGGGYEPAQPHENVEIDVPSLWDGSATADRSHTVPIRVCTFVKTALRNRREESVIYTFHSNGRFVATRTGVRVLINDLTNTYAYFSKVEVSFPKATRTQSIEGAKKLFDRLLPLLIRNHWPDFTAAEKKARQE